MGIFSRFPYTDFHRLNADWILEKVKEMLGLTQQAADDAAAAADDAAAAAAAAEQTAVGSVRYDRVQDLTTLQQGQARDNIQAAPANMFGAVRYDTVQLLEDPQKLRARSNIGAAAAADVPTTAVLYSSQSLTDEQKVQARTNIGSAAAADIPTGMVHYDRSQSLTAGQQTQARSNIDSASTASVGVAMDAIMDLNNVAVRVNSVQSFTDAQKAQARANIGAASVDASIAGAVMYSTSQTLSGAEKSRARSNIDALGSEGPTIIGGMTMENAAGTARYQSSISSRSGTVEWEFLDPNSNPIILAGVQDPQLTYDAANKNYVDSKELQRNSSYSGSTPSITPVANTLYICGEVTSITINSAPTTGEFTVRFQSGATPATLSLPADVLMPDDFQVDANRYYEINILDKWGVAASWGVEVVTP